MGPRRRRGVVQMGDGVSSAALPAARAVPGKMVRVRTMRRLHGS